MTSVDELFRRPNLPPSSNKRKLADIPDAQQAYKAAKISNGASPNGTRENAASVEDVEDDEDVEAGPDLPPEDGDDDEDGRFFGSGVTRDAADALDYIDQQDGETYQEEKIDGAWLRRLATNFERKVTKNAELRAKFESDPQKFMASEADLDAEIKSWSLLSEHPELYIDFAKMDSAGNLVGLLAHENTDIAIGAIEIISELIDEDVEAEQEQWDALVAALLEADLVELLMSNLDRLDEDNETDRSGVYHSEAIMEKLASQQSIAEQIGGEKLLLWLCKRIAKSEQPLGQNKQYAAEVLQVLLQSSSLLRHRLIWELDGVDLFLRLLAAYRKRDPPKDSHEEEFVENVFDCLTCVVEEAEGKQKFLEAEGIELCRIMLKEGTKGTVQKALRVLDHAAGGNGAEAAAVAERLVEAACLKPLFSIFAKKAHGESIEHLLGIFAALLRLLPGESAARIRTLAKFAEKDHEKVKSIALLRADYARRVGVVDKEIKQEQRSLSDEEIEDRSDEWFSRRLDGGLFSLQIIDVILAWLIAEDGAVKPIVIDALGSEGSLQDIRASLEEQKSGFAADTENEETKDMLDTLISFLG